MIYSARRKANKDLDNAKVLALRQSTTLQADGAPNIRKRTDQCEIDLAERIVARIEARLPGRIHRLTVYTTDNAVVLTGECCTFYTKQLAQHAAMGVLEYERLINNIDVRVAK